MTISYIVAAVLTPTNGSTQHATEGAAMNNATLGMLTDSNTSAQASDFTATTCWNDAGTPPRNNDCTTTTVSGSNGSFSVSGSHAFPEEGSYGAVTTVSGSDGSATINTPVTVADANLSATGIKVTFKAGKAFTKQVANFKDVDPAGTTSDLHSHDKLGRRHRNKRWPDLPQRYGRLVGHRLAQIQQAEQRLHRHDHHPRQWRIEHDDNLGDQSQLKAETARSIWSSVRPRKRGVSPSWDVPSVIPSDSTSWLNFVPCYASDD